MKKKLAAVLALFLAAGLAACGGEKEESRSVSVSEDGGVKGETFDTGRFSVLVPEGWKAFPVADVLSDEEDAVDDTQLYIYKGAETEIDMFSKCGATVYYFDADTVFWSAKDWYDNVEDLEPVVTGSVTWEGFKGDSYDVPCAVFNCGEEGDDQFSVTFILSADDGKETLSEDDPEILAILGSISVD